MDYGMRTMDLVEELDALKSENFYRKLRILENVRGTHAKLNGREVLLFCSNDYLGLSRHPEVVEAFTNAARDFGVGSGASRLISGSNTLTAQLEEKLASFKGKSRALVFASGYAANVGTISALAGKNDLLVIDKLNHASIVDACKLAGATIRVYPHGDVAYLEKILSRSDRFRRKLIVTDSVFSMDGDLAPLPEIVKLKERYGAWLMLDEAHGTGVFGPRGRGAAEHFGLEAAVDISMGTLSKAIGSLGGFVAGSADLIDYLVNRSRSFIFSTALPPAVMAASLKSLELISEDDSYRNALWQNVHDLRFGLESFATVPSGPASPIFPVVVGEASEALKLSEELLEEGFLVPAVRYPTVPKGKARLRLTCSAAHTKGDIVRLLKAIKAKLAPSA